MVEAQVASVVQLLTIPVLLEVKVVAVAEQEDMLVQEAEAAMDLLHLHQEPQQVLVQEEPVAAVAQAQEFLVMVTEQEQEQVEAE
jgi:hypothetical protein